MYSKKKNKFYIIVILLILFVLIYLPANTKYLSFHKYFLDIGVKLESFFIPKVVLDDSLLVSGINRELEDENNELKNILKLDTDTFTLINANVISRDSYWFNELIIDKGINDGINPDMAVVANSILIGKIVESGNTSSTVRLLSSNDLNMKVSVDIKNDTNTYHGILNGYQDGNLLVKVEKYSDIKVNDLVYTNGLGGVYPSGILIGKVIEVGIDSLGLEQVLKIDSNYVFNNIRYVTVINKD